MAVYVLVHGATGGGWQWREVASHLRDAAHNVFTPTLTGLGERSHLLTPDIGLDTHIQDIVNVLAYEDLREVVLIGKSYSGLVITGVAERAPERMHHLVYLDAIVPRHGQSFLGTAEPDVVNRIKAIVQERGDGWRLPADRSANPRLTDHPFKALTQPVEIKNPAAQALPRTYIYCTRKTPGTHHAKVTADAAQRAKSEG